MTKQKKKSKKKLTENKVKLPPQEQFQLDYDSTVRALQASEQDIEEVFKRMNKLNMNGRIMFIDALIGNSIRAAQVNPLMARGLLSQISDNIGQVLAMSSKKATQKPPTYTG